MTRFQRALLLFGDGLWLLGFAGFILELAISGLQTPALLFQSLILFVMGVYFGIETFRVYTKRRSR